MFALSAIASQNVMQIDPPLRLKMLHVSHLCAIQKKQKFFFTKTLNITADGNGLKMQSYIRPF